jgi:hypothetical protein
MIGPHTNGLSNLSPFCTGRGRRGFAAGEGHGTLLASSTLFADPKSPSPRKCGARERTVRVEMLR